MCRIHAPKVPNLWGAPHGRAKVDCMRATLILNEIWEQGKILQQILPYNVWSVSIKYIF
jgi:hypothetical protein